MSKYVSIGLRGNGGSFLRSSFPPFQSGHFLSFLVCYSQCTQNNDASKPNLPPPPSPSLIRILPPSPHLHPPILLPTLLPPPFLRSPPPVPFPPCTLSSLSTNEHHPFKTLSLRHPSLPALVSLLWNRTPSSPAGRGVFVWC